MLQPAGARGPAFLVGRNFRAVLRYNNATSYALGVSLLAQRIDGSLLALGGQDLWLEPSGAFTVTQRKTPSLFGISPLSAQRTLR